jgi:hypothetical protein
MKVFVFRIGPLPVNEGPRYVYYIYPGRSGERSVFADDDRAALREIFKTYRREEIECEPQLANAAAEFAIPAVEPTPERKHMIGIVTFDLALGEALKNIQRQGLIYQFGLACREFWDAEPWRRSIFDAPKHVEFEGSLQMVGELALLGLAGMETGLAIYPRPGAAAGVFEAMRSGRAEEALTSDTLGVTFEDGPEFAVDAMERAYGLARFPSPLKVDGGKKVPLSDFDIAALSAALRSVAALRSEAATSRGFVAVQDIEVIAVVQS